MDKSNYTTMMEALADVPDPRAKRGVRYPWALLLVLAGAAMVCGNKHGRAIAQWVMEHTQMLTESLQPPGGRLPSESTLRRALSAVDTDELEARLSAYSSGLHKQGQQEQEPKLCGRSLDGKAVRGVCAHGRKLHLLSVATHTEGIVLAQAEVAHKTNEIGAAPSLLQSVELCGTVVTVDALLAQRELASQILDGGGDYLMVIKANQPLTYEAISELFEVGSWMESEIGTRYWKCSTHGKGHGRLETRTLESSTVLEGWLDWPGVGQVLKRTCERVRVATGEVQRETTYAVTSLGPERAGPQELEGLWRGHWGIENKVHYVRDVTMGEDAGQAYTGSTPQAMAAIRNALIALLRKQGWKSIADALRHYAAHPKNALALLGLLPSRL